MRHKPVAAAFDASDDLALEIRRVLRSAIARRRRRRRDRGHGMKTRKKSPDTVCRWCRIPLRSGEREDDCPVKPLDAPAGRIAA